MRAIVPDLPAWIVKPRVHDSGRKAENKFPIAQFTGRQAGAATGHEPVAQAVVAEPAPEPADRVPAAVFENARCDEVAVGIPRKTMEDLIPEQGTQSFW